MYNDTIGYDSDSGELIYASIIDSYKPLKVLSKEFNKKHSFYVTQIGYLNTNGCKYDSELKKQPNSDYAHLIINKKDEIENISDSNDLYTCYIYTLDTRKIEDINTEEGIQIKTEQEKELADKLYDKLYKYTSVPILKEWMPFICSQLISHKYLKQLTVSTIYDEDTFKLYKLYISSTQLLGIISNGLKEKHADDIKFENGKYVFVGQVEDKKPYLKFVMTEENDKKFFELSLTEDETIKPIRMKNFY